MQNIVASVLKGAEPIEVWDAMTHANERQYWFGPGFCERYRWAQRNIPETDCTYRVEFYLIDTPFAVVYRWALNDEGKPYLDSDTHTAAVREPVICMLSELPPEEARIQR